MQRTFVLLALLTTLATTAQAQSWHSEFGIQSGYTRIKPAGTGNPDQIDVIGIPGFNLPGVLPGGASLFAILPWKNKIAIETSVSALQGNALVFGDATFFNVDLRGNYAITPKVYAAAGGALNFIETNGAHETQLGVEAAVGYRFGFIKGLSARVEASALFLGKANLVSAVDVYALEFGVSKRLGAATRSRTATPARASSSAWQPILGIQGGYTRSHTVGGGDRTAISVPGIGGSTLALGTPPGPPILFAILPVGRKFAIEPALDLSRLQFSGTTAFGANTSARVNYAVSGGWYGALGGNLLYVKATGQGGQTVTGVNVAWGYRFPLTSGLGGRFELDYTMLKENATAGILPTNTLGLQFGATIPLR